MNEVLKNVKGIPAVMAPAVYESEVLEVNTLVGSNVVVQVGSKNGLNYGVTTGVLLGSFDGVLWHTVAPLSTSGGIHDQLISVSGLFRFPKYKLRYTAVDLTGGADELNANLLIWQ